jgi:hypothetical protein
VLVLIGRALKGRSKTSTAADVRIASGH